MKILFVSPWVPSGIRPRSRELLTILARDHDIRSITLTSGKREEIDASKLPVPNTAVPNRRSRALGRVMKSLPTDKSLQSAYADVPCLRTEVDRHLREFEPDLLYLNVWRSAHLVEHAGGVPVLLDLVEFRSDYYRQLAVGGHALNRLVGALEAPRMEVGERRLVKQGVSILVSSPTDLKAGNRAVSLVRSPCPVPEVRDFDSGRDPVILFVGRLSYEANREALAWFVKHCWPEIRRRHATVKLLVAGSEPPRWIRRLADERTELMADFADIHDVFMRASVAIVPVTRGTGVQMKLIQALAFGIPTVTTRESAWRAGFGESDQAVVTASGHLEWIEATLSLLADSSRRESLSQAGWEWAREHHSIPAVRSALGQAVAGVVRERPGVS